MNVFKKLATWRQARKLRRIAREFNRWSVQSFYKNSYHAGEQWMCPDCGRVTTGTDWNTFSGWQFKQCCFQTWDGFRNYL